MLNKYHNQPGSLPSLWRGLFPNGKAAALITALSLSTISLPSLWAQEEGDEIFELSPFTVEGSENEGYRATSTLAGTRVATSLKDVGASISVYTNEFLEDVGAKDNEDLLLYATGTEVGGVRGNFTGTGNGATPVENGLFVQPNNNTRVRGLDSADNTRNYFRSLIPFDSYNTNRVDIVRGANGILFGLGSPAGIINNTTDGASFTDDNKVSFRYGQFDSYRASANLNRELIEGELGVRVAVLNDETKFRQKPAFSHSNRIYLATKWEPEFMKSDSAKTSFTANFESGEITSNRPRMMTPQDRITPFFRSGPGVNGGTGGLTVNPYVSTFGQDEPTSWQSLDDVPAELLDAAMKGFDANGNNLWGQSALLGNNREPWLRQFGNIFDGLISYSNSNTANEFQQARYRPHRDGSIIGTGDGRRAGINRFSDVALLNGLPFADLGVYKDKHISDRGVFDYVNNLLDGPNKSEFQDFEGYQLMLTQTMLDGDFGIELGFDHQSLDFGQTSLLAGGNGNAINIDINEVNPDGTPNPNLGRAAITSTYSNGNNVSFQERDQFRATAFYKLDLQEKVKGDFLGKLLGSHNFTAFYSTDDTNLDSRSYARYAAPVSFSSDVLQTDDPQITGPTRRINVIHYLSDDLRGMSWPTGLQGISGVVTPPSTGTLSVFDPTWTATGVDPAAPWTDTFFPRGGDLTQYDNPANWAGWSSMSFSPMDASTSDIANMYTFADLTREKIDSEAFVWQGYFLDGAIVPMFGYREDSSESFGFTSPKLTDFTVDVSPSVYALPSEASGNADGISKTYSVVAHVDELVGPDLPYGMGLSLFYNESENFKPAASRVNHLGRSISSPTGTTKDYGILISSTENKYSLRVNWYETNVQYATYTGYSGSVLGNLGWQTTMPWAYAKKAQNKVEGFSATNAWPEGGYNKWGNSPLTEHNGVTYTEQEVLDGFFAYIDSLPSEFIDAFNLKLDDAQWQINGWPAGMGFQAPSGIAATSDNSSKGVEYEFVANPTQNWRISLNLAKTDAKQVNIGGDISTFIEERAAAYAGPAGAVRLWGPGANPGNRINTWFRNQVWGPFQLAKLTEGSDVAEIRKWRANLVTNYNFTEGAARGFNIGGAARYMSGSIVGYPVIDNLEGQTDYIWNIANPYKSDSETRIDLWMGYRKKLNNKIDWRIQLNLTDAFADDTLIPINIQPDGSYGALRIPPSTSWFLTNTFDF